MSCFMASRDQLWGYQKLNEDERGREDLMVRNLAKENKWRRCPSCQIIVERTEGCLHMTCRSVYDYSCLLRKHLQNFVIFLFISFEINKPQSGQDWTKTSQIDLNLINCQLSVRCWCKAIAINKFIWLGLRRIQGLLDFVYASVVAGLSSNFVMRVDQNGLAIMVAVRTTKRPNKAWEG